MFMKHYYTYTITHLPSKMFYIGARSSNKPPEQDLGVRYFSSSKTLKVLIEKEGIKSFIFEVNEMYNNWSEAYHAEQKLISDKWDSKLKLNKSCYFGKKDFGVISDDAKKKISISSKKMWEKNKDKMIESQKNSWTPERRIEYKKIISSKWTSERKTKHSNLLKGHVGSKKLKGIPKYGGFGEKVSISLKGKNKTKKHKENISKSKKGKSYPYSRKLTPIMVNNIIIDLQNKKIPIEIAKEYNISMSTVYRIKKMKEN